MRPFLKTYILENKVALMIERCLLVNTEILASQLDDSVLKICALFGEYCPLYGNFGAASASWPFKPYNDCLLLLVGFCAVGCSANSGANGFSTFSIPKTAPLNTEGTRLRPVTPPASK